MSLGSRVKPERRLRALFSATLLLWGLIPLLLFFKSKAAFSQPSAAVGLAAGVFLVADPELEDPSFIRTVVLLLQHDQEGAMGLVINRRTTIPLSQLLPKAEGVLDSREHLFRGGPVSRETLTFLFRSNTPPKPMRPVFQDVFASREARVLADQLKKPPTSGRYHLYAGYAGWEPGQLEEEIARGDWRLAAADTEVLFEMSSPRIWEEMFTRTEQRFVQAMPEGTQAPAPGKAGVI